MKKFLCFLFAFSSLLAQSAELPVSLKVKNAGSFLWNGITLEYSTIFGNWQVPKIAAAETQKGENNALTLVSAVDYKGSKGEFKTEIFPLGKNRFIPADVKITDRYFSVTIPSKIAQKLSYKGAKANGTFEFPAEYSKMAIFQQKGLAEAVLELTNGEKWFFRTQGRLFIQDNRRFKFNSFSLRFFGKTPFEVEVERQNKNGPPDPFHEKCRTSGLEQT